MPKTMGTTAWHPNLQRLDTAADNVVHGARRERPKRSFERDEQLSMRTPRPSMLEILKYRITDRGHQRVILEPPLLGSFDPDDLPCPIEVFEAQLAHFAAAQAINGEQHQDGAVAYVTCIRAVGRGDKPLYVIPDWTCGEPFFLE
jgi:hypothetical protein